MSTEVANNKDIQVDETKKEVKNETVKNEVKASESDKVNDVDKAVKNLKIEDDKKEENAENGSTKSNEDENTEVINGKVLKKFPNTGHLVEVNGYILHYEKVGTGKIVALLMPGLMGSSRSDFPEQLDYMDRNKFTLIAWDPPGYGFSRAQERVYNKTVYADDAHLAAAMMKKIGYDQYCAVGWSDGGKTAINLASHYPDNVTKLVVWGVVCYRTPQTDKAFYLTKDVENFFDKQMAARFEAVYGLEYKKFWCKLVDDCYRAGIGRDEKIIPEALLKRIHCPALVLHGISDPMVKKEQAEYLNRNLVDSEVHYLKGSHNAHQTCLKEFNSVVSMFLLE